MSKEPAGQARLETIAPAQFRIGDVGTPGGEARRHLGRYPYLHKDQSASLLIFGDTNVPAETNLAGIIHIPLGQSEARESKAETIAAVRVRQSDA